MTLSNAAVLNTLRASMKMERFFSENGTDVSRTIKTNHIGFL